MNKSYLNIYNNLIKLTRNKLLYEKICNQDSFSDRFTIFLFHFAFFLKVYKGSVSKSNMQEIYDFVFKLVELSIREIGYGDSTINKKMNDYINNFNSIIDKVELWDTIENDEKSLIFSKYFDISPKSEFFVNYFEKYQTFLINNTLNHFTKDVISFKF